MDQFPSVEDDDRTQPNDLIACFGEAGIFDIGLELSASIFDFGAKNIVAQFTAFDVFEFNEVAVFGVGHFDQEWLKIEIAKTFISSSSDVA